MRCSAELHTKKTVLHWILCFFFWATESYGLVSLWPLLENQACPNSSFFSTLSRQCWKAANTEFTGQGPEPSCKSCSSSSHGWDQRKEAAEGQFLCFVAASRLLIYLLPLGLESISLIRTDTDIKNNISLLWLWWATGSVCSTHTAGAAAEAWFPLDAFKESGRFGMDISA